jgi:outer membrane immunogenic protein
MEAVLTKGSFIRASMVAVLLSTTTAAFAADIVEEPVVVPVFTWTGFYVGIVGGYNWGRAHWDVRDIEIARFNANGGTIGGTVGYNYQFYNNVVLGLETDLAWSGAKGDIDCGISVTCETKNTWIGTLRPRLGYAFDRFLPYITAGAAYGEVKHSVNDAGDIFSTSSTRFGWTAGAGVEYAFTDQITTKVEYLYTDLGRHDAVLDSEPVRAKWTSNAVRIGLNYKF